MSDRVYALIPARGGSKGIPRKNLQTVGGMPLVVRSIKDALRVPKIDAVYVSTDDAEIAKVSQRAGALVLERPSELAGDASSTESVIDHAYEVWSKEGKGPDALVLLQCTSPFRQPGQLEKALAHFSQSGCDSLLSVTKEHGFFWQPQSKGLSPLNYRPKSRPRRQDAETLFRETGSFYIFKSEHYLSQRCRLGGHIEYYEVPAQDAMEIDAPHELTSARRAWELRGEVFEALGLETISQLVIEVAGGLTDGHLWVSSSGEHSYRLHEGDLRSLRAWTEAGGDLVWLGPSKDAALAARAREVGASLLDIDAPVRHAKMDRACVWLGASERLLAWLKPEDYLVATANAEQALLARAQWQTRASSGLGAVWELVQRIPGPKLASARRAA